jgi:hypothetical protein
MDKKTADIIDFDAEKLKRRGEPWEVSYTEIFYELEHVCIYDEYDLCFECNKPKGK